MAKAKGLASAAVLRERRAGRTGSELQPRAIQFTPLSPWIKRQLSQARHRAELN